jgi:ABC-type uncharacterized transport system ATPase component
MLAGETMIALAKLKDEEFRPEIERIILGTENPRLKIMGSEALGMYRQADSLFCLLEILKKAGPYLYLRDESVLAMAAILGTQRQFYPVLVKYVADNSLTATLCADEVESALEYCKTTIRKKKGKTITQYHEIDTHINNFHDVVKEYIENRNGERFSSWILSLPDEFFRSSGIIKSVLSEAVIDKELCTYNCLCLLIVHWAAQQMRIWAIKIRY